MAIQEFRRHLRCEAGLSPEFVGTGPQRLPCRKVDRIGAGLALLPLDTPAGFHERVRAQPLRFRPQRVHGLAHPPPAQAGL